MRVLAFHSPLRRGLPLLTVLLACQVSFGGSQGDLQSPQALRANRQMEASKVNLGLNPEHAFSIIASQGDELGQWHTRFQQTYRGVKVWGGHAILHADAEGRDLPMTDALHRGFELATEPTLTPSEALAAANQEFAAKTAYAVAPQVELVVFPLVVKEPIRGLGHPASNASEFVSVTLGARLAYHIHLEANNDDENIRHGDYMVDAQNGSILHFWDSLETAGATGTGLSQYSGTVSLATNSTGTGFELRDITRGTGGTYGGNAVADMKHAGSGTSPIPTNHGTQYVDTDNQWGDGANYIAGGSTTSANGQTAAVDAAYGMQMTWDMYKNVLGRNGIDGNGQASYSRVHFGNNYDNAFWINSCFCMSYGDGSSSGKVMAALDVAGHEMSHGVNVYSANLDYSGETGGLNEANSDIFGTMAEFYARGGGVGTTIPDVAANANWTIGEQLGTNPFRYMYKPSKDNLSPDAWTPTLSNMDVHYSSGPMNRAFYFLSQGSSATSTSEMYSSYLPSGMTGLGNTKAAKIWYRTLTTYLTVTSDYQAARIGAVRAATDLYGALSAEYVAVQNAFHGINVGLAGDGTTAEDFIPPSVGQPTVTGSTGMIIFSTTASDTGGSGMASVDFYVDSVFVGSSSSGSPYSISVDSTQYASGILHNVTARAYDQNHNHNESTAQGFTLSNPNSQFLVNPGFEQALVGWTTTSGVDLATPTLSHSGTSAAWLGGYGSANSDSFEQPVSLPSTASSISLDFWLRVSTAETVTSATDTLQVEILDSTTGVPIQTLGTYSNLDVQTPLAYIHKSADLTTFKGQSIRIKFGYSEDAQNFTSFRIDDVQVAVQTPNMQLDLNGDATVDLRDLLFFAKNYGTTNATCDLKADGVVNDADLTILLAGL